MTGDWGVKRSTYGGHNNVPGNIPLQLLEVDEDALKLDDGQGRVGVVELDGNLLGELLPGTLGLLEAANDVVQRGGDPEVLLLQAQLLAPLKVVVGVEHGADGLGALLVSNGAFVVAAVELLEVKLSARRLAGPQAEVVGGGGVVAGDGHIVGHGLNGLAALPVGDGLAILVGGLVDMAIELDLWARGKHSVSQGKRTLHVIQGHWGWRSLTSTTTSWRGNSQGLKSSQ
jgi:hypothetical protein